MGVDETRPPNTEVLNTEVLQVQAQVEGWVATRVGATTSLTHSHTAAMAQGTVRLEKLQTTEKHMAQKAAELEQRLDAERHTEAQLERNLHEVKGQQEALNPHIEELHEKISGLQARSDAEKAALARQLELRECRVAHLQTVQADFFRARLGLRFDRSVPHVLRLVFTCIHPAAPLRECVVGVRVLEDDATYQVTECEPAVSALPPLLDALNATGDLRGFVIAIRGQFQSSLIN